MNIFWQITSIRKHQVAEANKILVEVGKPGEERDRHLHPEAYGLGEEYGFHYEQHKRMEIEREGEKN